MSDEHDELLRIARVRPRAINGITVIRLRGWSPLMVFIATLAVALALGSMAYPFVAMMGWTPRMIMLVATAAGALIVIVAVFLAITRHARIKAGYDDLIIDDSARAISLPVNFGRRTPTAMAIETITLVAPAEELLKSGDTLDAHAFGAKRYRMRRIVPDTELPKIGHRSDIQYAVVICWKDADGKEMIEPIVGWYDLPRANAFAHWLRDRLGVDVAGRS